MTTPANLFDFDARILAAERLDDLLVKPGIRIERIVSPAGAAPDDRWSVQAWDEWVLVVEGSAGLEIADEGVRRLDAGDHLLLPAGLRHRVAWTDANAVTVWLAVHLGEPVS